MSVRLKPLGEQVMVITGASSGIGLVTARSAARRGARVVICSRNEPELREAVREIESRDGQARYVVADVSRQEDVERVATHAVESYGSIDTWVNNAGVSFYGRIPEVPIEDMRRLFEVNFWGVVYGSRAALPYLRRSGGALINMGSVVSDRAIPLQGIYSASKHAVKGFTDALRIELEEEGSPVSVTLIKPSPIATPYFEHARNYMEVEPKPPAPVYAPELVAGAILQAAEHPVRNVTVGGGGRLLTAVGNVLPRLSDAYIRRSMFRGQRSNIPTVEDRPDNLFTPPPVEGMERGRYAGHIMRSSLYTRTALSPARALVGAAAGLAVFGLVRSLLSSRA
jgi:short-subunit dehydrogenase